MRLVSDGAKGLAVLPPPGATFDRAAVFEQDRRRASSRAGRRIELLGQGQLRAAKLTKGDGGQEVIAPWLYCGL